MGIFLEEIPRTPLQQFLLFAQANIHRCLRCQTRCHTRATHIPLTSHLHQGWPAILDYACRPLGLLVQPTAAAISAILGRSAMMLR